MTNAYEHVGKVKQISVNRNGNVVVVRQLPKVSERLSKDPRAIVWRWFSLWTSDLPRAHAPCPTNLSVWPSTRYLSPVVHRDGFPHPFDPRRRRCHYRNVHLWWWYHQQSVLDQDEWILKWSGRVAAMKVLFDYDDESDANGFQCVIHFGFDVISLIRVRLEERSELASRDIRFSSVRSDRGWNHLNNGREESLPLRPKSPADGMVTTSIRVRAFCCSMRLIVLRLEMQSKEQNNEFYESSSDLIRTKRSEMMMIMTNNEQIDWFTSDQSFHAFLCPRHAECLSSIVREAD